MNKIKVGVCFALCSLAAPSMAQYMWQEEDGTEKIDLREDIQYGVEMQGSFSKGKTPLWLNANKHGLSSLEKNNGYLRGSLVRPLSADSARRWAVGYGVDLAVPVNYTSHVVVQQAYVEARWLYGVLTAGAKEYPMELKTSRSPVVASVWVSMPVRYLRFVWRFLNIGRFPLVEAGCN